MTIADAIPKYTKYVSDSADNGGGGTKSSVSLGKDKSR